jgi:hypothetical protein
MIDKERLQRIGELIADLMRCADGKEKQGKLFKDAQTTLYYAANPLRFQPGIVSINKNGRIGFCLAITNPAGSAVIYYDPAPAIEALMEQLEKEASEEIDAMEFESDEEFEEVSADVYYSIVSSQSGDFIKMLLKLLCNEFENTVKSLPEIALKLEECIAQANLSSWSETIIDDDDDSPFWIRIKNPIGETPSFSVTEFINKNLRGVTNERKKHWIAVVNSSLVNWSLNGLEHLAYTFQRVYPIWREAKKIYREAQKSTDKERRERWRETILATYEKQLKKHSDLIGRLTDPPEVTDEIKEKLSKKGGTSAPSDIALEHAARLCGFEPYQYTIRYLKSINSKQGGSVRKVKSKQQV